MASAAYGGDHWSRNGQNGQFGLMQSNQIPKLHHAPSNPYYFNLVSSKEEPTFGNVKFVNHDNGKEASDGQGVGGQELASGGQESDGEGVFGHVVSGKESSVHGQPEEEEVYGTMEKSGTFHERPASESELGPIFGHVIAGPDGGQTLAGTFGSFSEPVDESSKNRNWQSSSQVTRSNSGSSSRRKVRQRTTSAPKSEPSSRSSSQVKSGPSYRSSAPGPGSMTANDFFGSVWHDKPVVVGTAGV